MKIRFRRSWCALTVILLGLVADVSLSVLHAQEAKTDAPAPAAAQAAPAVAEAPAVPPPANGSLPPYFNYLDKDGKPAFIPPDPTGGTGGSAVTPAGDGKGDNPNTMTVPQLYDKVAHNAFSINMMWVLLAGALVMFMQTGFALVEGGLCRAKNAGHTMAMNFMIYPLGAIAFWVYGFGIGWGNWYNAPVADGWFSPFSTGTACLDSGFSLGGETPEAASYGICGTKGFLLQNVDDVAVMALFFYMMVFMDTTATIPTGALAERWSWKSFCIYGAWVALPYCFFANWVWGGGWIAQSGKNWGFGHGAVDFAGSGVVHAMGGILSLAGILCLGPRIGKYVNGKPQAMPGHSIPMVVTGTFILAFGWFGFNGGSTLAGTDLRIAHVIVNTMLASCAAPIATMLWLGIKGLKPDPTMLCNGMLSGLVAITAPCAFVNSIGAVIIGVIAGILVVESVFFWDKLGIDDVVGAISVHGVNGLWGVISLGLFATGDYGAGWNGVGTAEYMGKAGKGVTGLFYGDAGQFKAQLLEAGVVCVFGFVVGYILFKLTNMITPLRVPKEIEMEGLDGPEMGAHGYPEFVVK
jgi:Amt family ammonium transporter